MKFSLHLIGRYTDLSDIDHAWIVDRVTRSVAEVESTTVYGSGLERVCAARIVEATPHGERGLTICLVDTGEGQHTVVCGAPNARAGLVTAYAPPGTQIGEQRIGERPLHGVNSRGMLCSPFELGLTEERGGICELPDATPPGEPLSRLLPLADTVFDVDNKSLTHRPDLWGHIGMAREIAAITRRPLRVPAGIAVAGSEAPPVVTVEVADSCPRYTAFRFGVPAIAPSPLWLQTLLYRLGIRPLSNVVDLTNFVMIEWGQPVHAFDARRIFEGHIVVRRALEREAVATLDGVARELTANDVVIADPEKALAIAGIMGLANSEIADDTTVCVLESANFRAEVVRRSAMRLRLRTEASARFEKSLDPELPPTVCRRFAELLRDVVPGSRVLSNLRDVDAGRPALPVIETSVSYINQRLGTSLTSAFVVGALEALEFSVAVGDHESLSVGVPSHRATKDISIADDLVEEVGRVLGYENIQPVHPVAPVPKPYRDPTLAFHQLVRTALSFAGGLHEVQNYSFDPEPLVARLGIAEAERIALRNPLGADATHLRRGLLPGVLAVLQRNRLSTERLGIYEIGRVFTPARDGIPDQPYHLAVLVWSRPPHRDFAEAQRAAVAEIKSIVTGLAARLGVDLEYAAIDGAPATLHPVRAANIVAVDAVTVGHLGAVHPRVCDLLEVGPFAAVAEFDLDRLRFAPRRPAAYEALIRFPALPVDISLVVPYAVTHQAIVGTLGHVGASNLKQIDYVGTFTGDPIPAGQKSVTYRLVFQAADRTLTKVDVAEQVEALVEKCRGELGASVRA